MNRRFPLVVCLACLGSLPALLAAEETNLEDYCKKAASVSPRDAQGLFDLSTWCEEKGLKKEARKLLDRVIEVDPDHAAARSALGYRRFGLGWKLGAERPRPPEPAPETDEKETGPAAGNGEKPPPARPAEGEPAAASEKRPGEAATGETATEKARPEARKEPRPEGEPVPKADKPGEKPTGKAGAAKVGDAAAVIAAKKAWMKEAGERMKQTFNPWEDEDFLIYTTFEASSPNVRSLTATLKAIKKSILTLTGAKASAPIWPEKEHFLFLRNAAECATFAEVVDGTRFPENQGYFTHDLPYEHTVIHRLEGDMLASILGETALDHLNGSDRWINWWMRQGVSGWLASQTEEGKKKLRYQKAFQVVKAELTANPNAVNIGDLFDSPGMPKRDPQLSQARALTLVDFLYQTNRRGFQKLIEDLKSDKAPAPPADNANFKEFFVAYVAYQEDCLNKIYRQKYEKLDVAWKAYIDKVSDTLSKAEKTDKTGGGTGKKTPPAGGGTGGGRRGPGGGGGTGGPGAGGEKTKG